MFILFNIMDNYKINWLADIRNKIFKFENERELLNFKGCLGLLLMNEFCFYYHKNNLKHCILCAMLITNFDTYLSSNKIIEKEYLEEINKLKKVVENQRNQKSIAGSTTKNEKYKQYCIKYMKDNNLSPYKAAEELANEFNNNRSEIRKKYNPVIGLKKDENDNNKKIEDIDYVATLTIYNWLKNK